MQHTDRGWKQGFKLLRNALKRIKHLKRNKKLQKQRETSDLSDLKPGSGLSALLCAGPDLSS